MSPLIIFIAVAIAGLLSLFVVERVAGRRVALRVSKWMYAVGFLMWAVYVL